MYPLRSMWLFSLYKLLLLITFLGYPNLQSNLGQGLCIIGYSGCRRFSYHEQGILNFYCTQLSLPFEKSSKTRVTINICPFHPLIQCITLMNAIITHSTSTITTFPYWQGVSIPRISYRYFLQSYERVK